MQAMVMPLQKDKLPVLANPKASSVFKIREFNLLYLSFNFQSKYS
jgi:hypothetical protein